MSKNPPAFLLFYWLVTAISLNLVIEDPKNPPNWRDRVFATCLGGVLVPAFILAKELNR